ncbi:MAG: SIS domain-containing protein, partial [Chloroflexota bacterium]
MAQEHPMLGNILSLADPELWRSSIELAGQGTTAWLDRIDPSQLERIELVGCGSSLYNAQVGKYVLERFAHISTQATPGFAFAAYVEPAILGPRTLVVGISTTGGTQTVCDSLARARDAGSPTLAITAHAGSLITQVAGATILTGGHNDA